MPSQTFWHIVLRKKLHQNKTTLVKCGDLMRSGSFAGHVCIGSSIHKSWKSAAQPTQYNCRPNKSLINVAEEEIVCLAQREAIRDEYTALSLGKPMPQQNQRRRRRRRWRHPVWRVFKVRRENSLRHQMSNRSASRTLSDKTDCEEFPRERKRCRWSKLHPLPVEWEILDHHRT